MAALLLETGDRLLQEDGSFVLTELSFVGDATGAVVVVATGMATALAAGSVTDGAATAAATGEATATGAGSAAGDASLAATGESSALAIGVATAAALATGAAVRGYARFYPWSGWELVMIPDPQGPTNPYLSTITQWLANNWTRINGKMVCQPGDLCLNSPDSDNAIGDVASPAMATLDAAEVPYMMVLGNHDVGAAAYPGNISEWVGCFGSDKRTPAFNTRSYWGGSYDINNTVNYALFTDGVTDYILVGVSWPFTGPTWQTVYDWASGVLTTYASRTAIVFTHAWLNGDGTYSMGGKTGAFWTTIVAPHENVRIIINGHSITSNGGGYERYQVETMPSGRKVHQILANYQEFNDTRWSQIMRLRFNGHVVRARTFNPMSLAYTANDVSFSL